MNRKNNQTPEKINDGFTMSSTSILGSVCNAARKHLRPKEVTPKLKPSFKKHRITLDCSSDEDENKTIIDLTKPKVKDLLPGTPFHKMKEHNSLFYVYDPRGYGLKHLPKGFCVECRCPNNYCASLMYSKIINKRVNFLIEEKGSQFMEEEEITDLYEEIYSINVYAQLLRNGITTFEERLEMTLPACLERRGLKKLLKELEKKNEAEDAWNWESHDCTISRIEALAKRYKTNQDGELRIYEGRKPCYEVRNFMLENKEKKQNSLEVETSDV